MRRPTGAWFAAVALLLMAVLAGCSTNPATGEEQFTPFMSPGQEQHIGADEHPKILAQYGGVYEDLQIGGYVAEIGSRLVAASETPKQSFTFTVLDSDVVNAFALPGGYVYITRGLLALINTEAELAGVLAHEIGHVTARHTAQRYNRAMTTNLLTAVLGAATGSQALAQLGQVAGAVSLAQYSQEQEFQADLLGVRYMSRIGYNPLAQADLLSSLNRETNLQLALAGKEGEDPSGGWFASHPNTVERVRRAIEAAHAQGTPQATEYGRESYLRHVAGLVYGDSAAHGFVRGQTFSHPGLRITFTVPPGFQLVNRPEAVYAKHPNGAAIRFDSAAKARSNDPLRYLTEDWAARLSLRQVERITINGMQAATGATRVQANGEARDLRLIVIATPDRLYRFLFLTPPSVTAALTEPLQRTTYSFRRLSEAEANALHPYRIAVETVRPGDTIQSLAARMALPDHKLEWFKVLNAIDDGVTLRPGEKVKLVVEGPIS